MDNNVRQFPLEILGEFARHMDFETLRTFALICAPFLAAAKILPSQLIRDKRNRQIADRLLLLETWDEENFKTLNELGRLYTEKYGNLSRYHSIKAIVETFPADFRLMKPNFIWNLRLRPIVSDKYSFASASSPHAPFGVVSRPQNRKLLLTPI
jgi:hypothetical protein